jgi:hypothetical protein
VATSVGADDLAFPVLAVGRQMTVMVFKDASSLQTANALAIRRGVFQDLLVIDRNGRSYSVSTARVVGPATRFFGFRFMKPRLLRVALQLCPTTIVTLADTQEKVVAAMNEAPELWDATWDRDWRSLQAGVRSTTTFPELFALLAE